MKFFLKCLGGEDLNHSLGIRTLDVDSPELVHYKYDSRNKVIDTQMYPHNAIGRMIVRFHGQVDEYGGTGFLTDDYIFVTAAHNLRVGDSDGIKDAEEIAIYFGLDADDNRDKVKPIQLHGRDFTVPEFYLKPTDYCDIAWIDLKQYAAHKLAEKLKLNWSIDDLPTTFFYKCKIPQKYGAINGDFSICGNFIFIVCIQIRTLRY